MSGNQSAKKRWLQHFYYIKTMANFHKGNIIYKCKINYHIVQFEFYIL